MKKKFTKKWIYGLIVILIILLVSGCVDDTESQNVSSLNQTTDTTPPVINSEQDMFSIPETELAVEYLSSVSAYDEVDGDLTEKMEIDDSKVRYGQVGTYQITATVSDSSGNVCTQSFNVIIKDTIAPILSLSQTTFSLTAGDSAPDYAGIATANDNVDGDITSSIVIDSTKVNYNSAGTYEVTYTITDSSGNSTVQKATVTIKAKSTSSSTNSGSVQVLITRTGECYHRRKCGNGTYFWVTFQEAKNRGLRACNKCY